MASAGFPTMVKLYDESAATKAYSSHDLLEFSENMDSCRPFRPANVNDFVAKQKYGVVKGDKIVFLNILKMCATEEELDIGRPHKPKRLSHGSKTFISKKNVQLLDEGADIKLLQAKMKQTKKQKRGNDDVWFDKLQQKDKKQSGSANCEGTATYSVEGAAADHHDEAAKRQGAGKGLARSHEDEAADKRGSGDLQTPPSSSQQGDKEAMECGHDEEAVQNNAQDAPPVSPATPGRSGQTSPVSEQTPGNAEGCKNCIILLDQIAALKQHVQELKNEKNVILEDIKSRIDSVPARIRVLSPTEEFLKEVKYIVHLEKKYKDKELALDDTVVYCGEGRILKKVDIYDLVELTSFGRRLAGLATLFWGDEGHRHFLSGKPSRAVPAGFIPIKISDTEIKAMKRILAKMPWENMKPKVDLPITDQLVRSSVKHHTSILLSKFLGTKRERSNKKDVKKSQKHRQRKTSGSSVASQGDSQSDSGSHESEGEEKKKREKKQNGGEDSVTRGRAKQKINDNKRKMSSSSSSESASSGGTGPDSDSD